MDQDKYNNSKGANEGNRVYNGSTAVREYPKEPLWFIKSKNTIYYILGLIEVLLAFRFIFKLLGANPRSGFVSFLYALTGIFTGPFTGIFNPTVTNGLSSASIFEPAALIAMIVYAIAAWGLINLLRLKFRRDGH